MNLFKKIKALFTDPHGAASPSAGHNSGAAQTAPEPTAPPQFSIDGYIDERRIKEIDRRVMECLVPGGKLLITPEHAKAGIGRDEAERIATAIDRVLLDYNLHEVAYYILVTKFNFVRQGGAYLSILREQLGDERFRALNDEEEIDDPFGLGDLA